MSLSFAVNLRLAFVETKWSARLTIERANSDTLPTRMETKIMMQALENPTNGDLLRQY